MKKNCLFYFLCACTTIIGTIFSGCTKSEHFISDASYREKVTQAVHEKQALFADTTLFSILDTEMTPQEREAMEFLYAYMPIGDIADYDGNFYLKNVRSTFATREEMPWGKQIPEIIFRHFVLPIRVNNENLDESRMIFHDELKDRVKGLSLYDAVLEVNHWCHEKVIYTPSDSRTSAALASVKSAYGRCGEESTFTVAALRSVGIPARQVYTPRWAHTDDNHAWVEAWVDGKWYFMGACEPMPVLNLGWFNAPAYRGMLMHTKVFGDYDGPEEVMERTDCYTEINVIDNYAPTAKTIVTVTNADGSPTEGALVEFKLYNYAEFYSVARKTTDKDGHCSLSAGKGDMLLWASKDGKFGYRKVSFGKDNEVTIALDKNPGDTASVELDIVPPVEGSISAEVTDEQIEANEMRMLQEDSIRNKYVATFCTSEKAEAIAKKLVDSTKARNHQEWVQTIDALQKFIVKSRGNHDEIEKLMHNATNTDKVISLLNSVSDKDLRDTPADVFLDHLNNVAPYPEYVEKQAECTDPFWAIYLWADNYLLNPRVSNELLTPYRSFFIEHIDTAFAASASKNPQVLVDWVKKNIAIHNELNPQRIPIMPTGVWKARIADTHSRDIFFVAVARSLGIISRIDPVTGKVQYFQNDWVDVDFEASEQTVSPKGFVTATYEPIKALDNPKYYSHFTIAKINDNAQLQTLNFESDNSADMGWGDTYEAFLKMPMQLDEGNYLLVNGTRMASGKVLARLVFFPVKTDETTKIDLVMREDTNDIEVIGSINAEAMFTAENGDETSILNTTGRGYFIIGILGARQEPTNHALRDIAQLKADFEKWNRGMVLLFKDEKNLQQFDKKEFGELPETISYGIDKNGVITKMVADAMKLKDTNNLPIFIIADTFGRVVFVSQGYTIGLGEQMMNVIHKL